MSLGLPSTLEIFGAGTPEGARRAWDTRGRGRKSKESKRKLSQRAARARESHVPLTTDKKARSLAAEMAVAKGVGGEHIADDKPFDAALFSKKILFEVKAIFEDAKNDKINVHGPSKKDPIGSQYRKMEYAKKLGSKNMIAVAVSFRRGTEGIYIRRFMDPKDTRPGWSFHPRNMTKVSSFKQIVPLVMSGKSLEVRKKKGD